MTDVICPKLECADKFLFFKHTLKIEYISEVYNDKLTN